MQLFAHHFSSYCQKVLIALYENETPFEFRDLSPEHPDNNVAFERLWPLKKMPILVDGERTVMEATIIIEYLDLHHAGRTLMLPADPRAALEVRLMDRFFDNYVMTPMQRIVFDALRPQDDRDPYSVDDARKLLDNAYAWLDRHMTGRQWAALDTFSLADCAAAPSLFYADWVQPLGERFANVRAYRQRLLARPSFARAVDEARRYRHFFPLGAPDRN
ncbi:MAG TPA: glutathione S-transferase family protein [Candidatus Binatia bacterium]|nr:glutathione S-transferase family protein [Candidatus Binatia bacterium]